MALFARGYFLGRHNVMTLCGMAAVLQASVARADMTYTINAAALQNWGADSGDFFLLDKDGGAKLREFVLASLENEKQDAPVAFDLTITHAPEEGLTLAMSGSTEWRRSEIKEVVAAALIATSVMDVMDVSKLLESPDMSKGLFFDVRSPLDIWRLSFTSVAMKSPTLGLEDRALMDSLILASMRGLYDGADDAWIKRIGAGMGDMSGAKLSGDPWMLTARVFALRVTMDESLKFTDSAIAGIDVPGTAGTGVLAIAGCVLGLGRKRRAGLVARRAAVCQGVSMRTSSREGHV